MKKIIVLLLSILATSAFAQNYEFTPSLVNGENILTKVIVTVENNVPKKVISGTFNNQRDAILYSLVLPREVISIDEGINRIKENLPESKLKADLLNALGAKKILGYLWVFEIGKSMYVF